MSTPEQCRAAALQRVPSWYFPIDSAQDLAGPNHPLLGGSPGGDALLERDDERDAYLAAKRAIVRRAGRGPLRLREHGSSDAIEQAEHFLRAQLCEAEPARFDPQQLAQRGLDALLMEIQEDLVVMHRPAGYAPERARAHYLHVCFPSNWSPARMLGKSFLSLHAHVPATEGFERSARAQHAAALFSQPAVRFVWSVSPDALLDHHPESARPAAWDSAEELFLRVERQVILPLPAAPNCGQVTLFFIRTYVYPRSRLGEAERRTLAHAVAHMPAAVRRYKGILGHEARIQALLANPARAVEET
jgi:hypothetical protein